MNPPPSSPARRLRRPGRLGRVFFAIAASLLLVVAGFGLYEYSLARSGTQGTTLVVYTYASFLGGNCGGPNVSAALAPFESAHDVTVDLVCPNANLVAALQDPADYGLPPADLVVGLDEITAPEAEGLGLLLPYAPSELADVPAYLASGVSPDHGVVPYEWGYLAVDYTSAFENATGGAVAEATLPEFVENSTWAAQLVTENPIYDITGEEFLAWQIEYYSTVLHESWETFWQAFFGEPHPNPAPDWGTAFDEFGSPPGENQLVVSYSTDPAYAAAYGEGGTFNSTVSWWNGTAYGWRTIYGVGLVAGTRHTTLAEAFESYLLSGPVQAQLPTSEWEYPANDTVAVPSVFGAAIDPASVVALNNATSPAEVAANLTAPMGWLATWQSLAGSS